MLHAVKWQAQFPSHKGTRPGAKPGKVSQHAKRGKGIEHLTGPLRVKGATSMRRSCPVHCVFRREKDDLPVVLFHIRSVQF